MISNQLSLVLLLSVLQVLPFASAKIELPKWFGNDMVLQTNAEYGARSFLNGKAHVNEPVTVYVIHGNRILSKSTVQADAMNGDWKVQLDPQGPGGGFRIIVTGLYSSDNNNTVVANNVSFGDVFFCSGQSNMVYPLKLSFNATQEVSTLKDFPNFSFFVSSRSKSKHPHWDLPDDGDCDVGTYCNRWVTQSEALQENYAFLMDFSAVCFLTVRDMMVLLQMKNRPVALIQTAWGGTRVEAWMSQESIQSTAPYQVPPETEPRNAPSVLYNAMIHPWNNFAVRAVLWYQGEANSNQVLIDKNVDPTDYYATMYQAMIADWRWRKGMGDFAWGTVQLPPSERAGSKHQAGGGFMEIRLAQAETVPHANGLTDNSAVAVTLDLGGKSPKGYIHPPNKNEVSRRLALGVLHAAYATQTPLWTGPVLDAIHYLMDHNSLVIEFANYSAGGGMQLRDVKGGNADGTRNDCLKCCSQAPPFEVLVAETWEAIPFDSIRIEENSVVCDLSKQRYLRSAPSAVRYAWANFVECVLENSDGLVASPFVYQLSKEREREASKISFKDNKLLSPPMGFNSWNFYHCNIDENTVKAIADAMVANGMQKVGYRYVNLDDCWQVDRFPNGTIQPDPARFPSGMKALADYVHSLGLKLGLYTARGSRTCQRRPGSYTYEELDAQTYCDWGIDYVKNDNCGGSNWPQANTSWIKFRTAFDACEAKTGRSMTLSVEYCSSIDGCGEWIANIANLWRTTGDMQANWESVLYNIHAQEPMYILAKPGHFNDPDMLEIGNVGLTTDEQYSQMALWCVAGAPLLSGTDLMDASSITLDILTNPEVVAVNQDLGWKNQVQGRLINKTVSESEVWAKRLADGSWAIVLLNLNAYESMDVTVRWVDLGLEPSLAVAVRDLWARREVGTYTAEYKSLGLRPHQNRFLRISLPSAVQ